MWDSIGIIGVLILLAAYALIQTEKVNSRQLIYPIMNFVGAACIVLSLIDDWNLPAFLMEASWMIISIWGMWHILKKRREKENE